MGSSFVSTPLNGDPGYAPDQEPYPDVEFIHLFNHRFFTHLVRERERERESIPIGTEKPQKSRQATGDSTQGLRLGAPGLRQLTYHSAATTELNNSLLQVYRCKRCAVLWLTCHSIQPTAADTRSCHMVYGNSTGETYLTGELVHLCHHSYFHPSEESTDIGTKKQKRSRQRYYGRNPGPVGMRTSALTYELSQRNQKCPGQSHRPRLPMSGHHCWLFAMLQSTAKSGRHHELLCAE